MADPILAPALPTLDANLFAQVICAEEGSMFTEVRYQTYIRDFNSAFVGRMSLEDFFDTY